MIASSLQPELIRQFLNILAIGRSLSLDCGYYFVPFQLFQIYWNQYIGIIIVYLWKSYTH